jgi:hypothetical protein
MVGTSDAAGWIARTCEMLCEAGQNALTVIRECAMKRLADFVAFYFEAQGCLRGDRFSAFRGLRDLGS